jgi:hypothetical protein
MDRFATHCLHIGDTDDYIRRHTERSEDVPKKKI